MSIVQCLFVVFLASSVTAAPRSGIGYPANNGAAASNHDPAILNIRQTNLTDSTELNFDENESASSTNSNLASQISVPDQFGEVGTIQLVNGSSTLNITVSPCCYKLDVDIGQWTFYDGTTSNQATWYQISHDISANAAAQGGLKRSYVNAIQINAALLNATGWNYLSQYLCPSLTTLVVPGTGSALSTDHNELRHLLQVFHFVEARLAFSVAIGAMATGPCTLGIVAAQGLFGVLGLPLAHNITLGHAGEVAVLSFNTIAMSLFGVLTIGDVLENAQDGMAVAGLVATMRRVNTLIVASGVVAALAAASPGSCVPADMVESGWENLAQVQDEDVGLVQYASLQQQTAQQSSDGQCPSNT